MIDLRLGDCLELMRALPDGSVDLVVTSPPYDNIRTYGGHTWDFDGIARELSRVVKAGGVVVWVVCDQTVKGSETGTSFRQVLRFMELGFNLHDTMIYSVGGVGAKGSVLSYWQSFEYMFVLSKGRPKAINLICDVENSTAGTRRWRSPKNEELHTRISRPIVVRQFGRRTNIWTYKVGWFNKDDKTTHPAPFPEALARDHILSWSNEGDTVLDPLMGSGTTGKMAVKLNRNFIGMEINPDYFAIAERRIAEAQQQMTLEMAA